MISQEEIKQLTKKYKINESIVTREYIQLLFLKMLYAQKFSNKIFFKGGTAIRLLYDGERFSEDLDFTVELKEKEFDQLINQFFSTISNQYPIIFKKRKSLAGKTYLLTAKLPNLKSDVFVKLDFSFREKVLEPTQSILTTSYPIVMQGFINSLSKNEILSEKIRAIMTRRKHRDLYDLWILLENSASINQDLINKKLSYYNQTFNSTQLITRLKEFTKQEFIIDLRPFVPINERSKLGELFEYVNAYLTKSFTS